MKAEVTTMTQMEYDIEVGRIDEEIRNANGDVTVIGKLLQEKHQLLEKKCEEIKSSRMAKAKAEATKILSSKYDDILCFDDTEDLLVPCPFCNKRAVITAKENTKEFLSSWVKIRCGHCWSQSHAVKVQITPYQLTKLTISELLDIDEISLLVDHWNTRPREGTKRGRR